MPEPIEIDGFDQLRAALIVIPDTARPIIEKAVSKACYAVVGQLKEYPPATEANRPGRKTKRGRPMGYYERGRGSWYPVMRRETILASGVNVNGKMRYGKTRGVIKARSGSDVAGYKLSRGGRSQQLGKHWAVHVSTTQAGIEGIIGTTVSYAKPVHVNQPPIFAIRGWKTVKQAFALAHDDIVAAFEDAADEIARLLRRKHD
jgi:hypothetical protein